MNENNANNDIKTLISHIEKHLRLLEEAVQEIAAAKSEDIPKIGQTSRAAVLLSGLIENYYTCLETVFVRISQFFENDLSSGRWHKDLLEKMTLEIESVRPRVISDAVFGDLVELMRFRHFKRYYFGTSYDWTRLEELLQRVKRTHPILINEIAAFVKYMKALEL